MRIPEGYAQISYVYGGSMQPTGAVCSFGVDISEFEGSPPGLAEDFHAFWITYFKGNVGSGLTLEQVMVKYGPNDTGFQFTLDVNEAGSVSSQGAAPQACFLIRKNTAVGGRSGRGRMYQPGVYESATGGDGIVTAGVVSNWNDDLLAFAAAAALNDTALVLLHSESTPGALAPYPSPVWTCETRLATQRHRMRR